MTRERSPKYKSYQLNDAQLDIIAWAESQETLTYGLEVAIAKTLHKAFDTQFLLKQKLDSAESRVQKLRDSLKTESEKEAFDNNRKLAYRRRKASMSGLLSSFVRHKHLGSFITATCYVDEANKLVIDRDKLAGIDNLDIQQKIMTLEGISLSKSTAAKLGLKVYEPKPIPIEEIPDPDFDFASFVKIVPANPNEMIIPPEPSLGERVKALLSALFHKPAPYLEYSEITPYEPPYTEEELTSPDRKRNWWDNQPSPADRIEPQQQAKPPGFFSRVLLGIGNLLHS